MRGFLLHAVGAAVLAGLVSSGPYERGTPLFVKEFRAGVRKLSRKVPGRFSYQGNQPWLSVLLQTGRGNHQAWSAFMAQIARKRGIPMEYLYLEDEMQGRHRVSVLRYGDQIWCQSNREIWRIASLDDVIQWDVTATNFFPTTEWKIVSREQIVPVSEVTQRVVAPQAVEVSPPVLSIEPKQQEKSRDARTILSQIRTNRAERDRARREKFGQYAAL